ncbi:TRAP transporter small permease subunit [Sneathiella chungangensis]|uniref:TRAP transporter small permease protein n=1 Tax=Sneathiella chungangensis TaxID=1418234 RepID=A0A845MI61_9PROT|nr:TRAP transporter small permease [Sneathiella chungangensis]MZR22694.1 TRAP transporter small permease subunit [Sneathiella chungangensis]
MESIIRRLEQVALTITIGAMIILMIVISLDAVLRYSINSPIQWAADLATYYIMSILIYFALSPTFRSGDHIRITLISAHLPDRMKAISEFMGTTLAAIAFFIIAYGATSHAIDGFFRNEFLPGYIMWPGWLSYLPIAIGAGILCLRFIHHLYMLVKFGRDNYVCLEDEAVE